MLNEVLLAGMSDEILILMENLFSLGLLVCFSAKDVAVFFHPLRHIFVIYFDTAPATTGL